MTHYKPAFYIALSFLLTGSLSFLVFENALWGITALLIIYMIGHLHQAYQFAHWLKQQDNAIRIDLSQTPAKPKKTFGIWRDLHDIAYRLQIKNHKKHKKIARLLNRAEMSANAIQDGVIIVNQAGRLDWWNQAANDLLNLQYDSDKNRPITHLIRHPSFVAYFNEGDYKTPFELSSPDNLKIQLQINITRFNQDERLLFIRNITNLHQLEQIRTDFVANVSHELRTPLTVLVGYIEAFENAPIELPKNLIKGIQHMREQSKRMQAMIDDLLLLSRLEQSRRDTQFITIAISEFLTGLVDEVEILSLEKNISINIFVEAPFSILGNKADLHSAFLNLLTNAIKYSPKNSHIDIKGLLFDDGQAQIQFVDHGIGIDPAFIPRLTERFFRVDASRATASGGTGLGLAIVKHVMLHHQATLIIESEQGTGSQFICAFPKERILGNSRDSSLHDHDAAECQI